MNRDVSAVIVTDGRYNIDDVIRSLPFSDVVVWNNAKEKQNRKVYGRYLAVERAKHDLIYIQDDDCLIDAYAVVRDFHALRVPMVCNVPEDRRADYARDDITLVGWGSVFHRREIDQFNRYFAKYPIDDLFERECDRVFSYLVSHVEIDIGVNHLRHAYGKDRMGTEKRHGSDLKEIRRRLYTL